MEQNLENEKEYIRRETIRCLAWNLILTMLYFVILFYLCEGAKKAVFWVGMIPYVFVELILCATYLRVLQKPIDQMIDTVKNASQDEYEAQTLRSQAEIYALQSQINPHFLYNTLDTIRSYALSGASQDIAAMTESLSTLFRYSISKPGEMVTLKEELDNVRNYLLIQQHRFPDKVEYIENIEDPEILQYRLPILTVQPIVENAIHHGLEMKIGNGYIKVRGYCTDSHMVLMIKDNGLGMSERKLADLRRRLDGDSNGEVSRDREKGGSGIALINVDKRLKFYYGHPYGLRIQSTLDVGTTIEIQLPFDRKEGGTNRERGKDEKRNPESNPSV